MQARLQRLWMPFIARNAVAEAIELVARDNSYHPIRDWLDGLTWDGDAAARQLACHISRRGGRASRTARNT